MTTAHDHARTIAAALGYPADDVPTLELATSYLAYLAVLADQSVALAKRDTAMREAILGPDPQPANFDGLDEHGNPTEGFCPDCGVRLAGVACSDCTNPATDNQLTFADIAGPSPAEPVNHRAVALRMIREHR